ncbi:vacuole membrane protein 1-like isoform X1 [Ischnura elegans]|uniref:vacuole membrane protein 1-like isoform X1 n=2 Tax=Ischnura elegans TaxID=197161 RepID=UPI001ED8AB0D|nr:vacuole membrane protein 1-like isoform X1 [Ischnura elegans]XP_046386217.1 vacuole membrane protein 1-like isoform X1 [Ischnura elegans]XP_046386218.1 vacuole membrane protein 1-like isoform X1 [Ischnura elegans]XP_046386219.1 vacuole membrane protein 1-like isoform X1 [Ischnura elegans]XP_046386220.1 vacuole membrane protein 1-like isoform X1 [Ischnura elegans]
MGSKKNNKTKGALKNSVKNAGNVTIIRSRKSVEIVDQSDLQKLSKDQLKSELKKRGVKSSGNKTELVQRLEKLGASGSMPLDAGAMTGSGGKHKGGDQSRGANRPNGDTYNSNKKHYTQADRRREKEERSKLVLWRRPLTTLDYFRKELFWDLNTYGTKLLQYRVLVGFCIILAASTSILIHIEGPHQKYLDIVQRKALWCLYWVGLGVLSSVGLGTGLHTFLLYLGPHIASVTLAAYECGSLRFPEPPYPDEIICPEDNGVPNEEINILAIMSKVRLEACLWGAGTALGELPPYFMARAARRSGYDPDDEDDLREFEELQRKKRNPSQMTFIDRAKLGVERLVEKVGFFGILACASIPNPLFDLAGITCGHFLVPFWTFFGATLIGKAVVKMHIQKMFVIIAFNEVLVERAVGMLARVPYIGKKLQEPFKEFLVKQKTKLHRSRVSADTPVEGNLLSYIFEKFVICMILYFVVSIINSLAQSHHKRLHKKNREQKKVKD